MILTYRCRDIGYGIEEGQAFVLSVGPYDWVHKREYVTVSDDGVCSLYLFDDEIIKLVAA